MGDDERRVDLLAAIEVLHEHLTAALCDQVWEEVRETEREREFSLHWLMQFWTAVLLRAPDSLSQGLAEANRAAGAPEGVAYPPLRASRQAFFSRCSSLPPDFFERLFECLQERLQASEPPRFARPHHAVAKRFGGNLYVLDASTLDAVRRRLKLLRNDRRVPMPGMVIAFYDLCHGRLARLHYSPELQPQEGPCARALLEKVPEGALLVGDRLYGQPVFMAEAQEQGLWFVVRRHARTNFEVERELSSYALGRARVTESIGVYGTSRNTQSQRVRVIRKQEGNKVIELVTNVLDPKRLKGKEALELYRGRWKVERVFYELKEVLNLKRFYAGNVNAVAIQVYVAGIVHLALRAAQGRIAHSVGLEPEALSTPKLFVKLAVASTSLVTATLTYEAVCAENPGVRLKEPDWRQMPFAWTTVKSILVEHRGPGGRKKRIKPDGRHLRRLPPAARRRRN
jgi:hypothetical protein